jgi:hypothetical protein
MIPKLTNPQTLTCKQSVTHMELTLLIEGYQYQIQKAKWNTYMVYYKNNPCVRLTTEQVEKYFYTIEEERKRKIELL